MTVVLIALMLALIFGAYNTGLPYQIGRESATMLQSFWFGILRMLPLIIVSKSRSGY
ncbi:MAG: hypothetical protein MZV64_35790 [Ignavibacteriales bacterium]|nr:hypothetical protein [Ignavibacteriales bacterium]